MNIIELAKEAGAVIGVTHIADSTGKMVTFTPKQLERFAALVRAEVMKQVMDTCEAEYKNYDELVKEGFNCHEEAVAMIHLMRKLEKLK